MNGGLVPQEIAPGRLSSSARSAATATALDLLGTYFADAPTWQLEHGAQLAPTEDLALADLAEAIRLRVGLSAARRLDVLLHRVAQRLSFRYERVADETIGAVRGRLDVPRYIQSRAKRDVPRRYPVRVLERRHRTPENVLAMYAAGWVRHELANVRTDILPPRSPERRELVERTASLTRTLNHPVLAEAAIAASETWRNGRLDDLLEEVHGRLDGGHVAGPEPYRELAAWVEGFDPSAVGAGTSVEWAFYDARFDPKLFEIWLMHRLAAALSRKLGLASAQRPLWERNAAATYTWKLGAASVRLHFQLALSGLSQPVWIRESGDPFDGIPDLTVVLAAPGSKSAEVLVDAKLRQRDTSPTEEIYKLLGYFQNRGTASAPCGAIVYYAPEGQVIDRLTAADGGAVLSLGVDPHRGDADDVAFDALAEMIVRILDDLDPAARVAGSGLGDAPSDADLAQVQEKAVSDLLLRAQSLPTGSLDPYSVMLQAQIPKIWDRLDADLKTILTTAEYFGATAPEGADLSGPLLGLSAACERLLCGEGQVLSRLAAAEPDHVRSPTTLGTAFLLKKARRPREARDEAVRAFIDADVSVDGAALLAMAGALLDLNGHRRAAAHTEVVLRDRWRVGRGLVLGSGDSATPGLLARLVEAMDPERT